uniref:Mpv17-like protein 2 n=1 Tax=Glossina brevipalpis TaxID=37001 RepID=A0A1A9WG75_9MUSC
MLTRSLQRFANSVAIPTLLKKRNDKLCLLYRHQLLKTTIIKRELNQKSSNNSNNGSNANYLHIFWKNVFGKYLLLTNIAGSGILMVVGDVMAQEIEFRKGVPKSKRYDLERMGRMFIAGALMGPLHHYVYNWMEKVMPVPNLRNTIRKILIDQIFMSPACLLIFFYSACLLEGKTITDTNAELKEKFLFIYLIDWLLWPGAQYINFRYVDIKYRVTYVNVCTAVYDVFISYIKHLYEDIPTL